MMREPNLTQSMLQFLNAWAVSVFVFLLHRFWFSRVHFADLDPSRCPNRSAVRLIAVRIYSIAIWPCAIRWSRWIVEGVTLATRKSKTIANRTATLLRRLYVYSSWTFCPNFYSQTRLTTRVFTCTVGEELLYVMFYFVRFRGDCRIRLCATSDLLPVGLWRWVVELNWDSNLEHWTHRWIITLSLGKYYLGMFVIIAWNFSEAHSTQ
jgi:hypothetical protein